MWTHTNAMAAFLYLKTMGIFTSTVHSILAKSNKSPWNFLVVSQANMVGNLSKEEEIVMLFLIKSIAYKKKYVEQCM